MIPRQLFEKMPKAELHLHLDGAFTLDHLFELTKKYSSDSEIKSIDDLKKQFRYKDFSHFINLWFWKNGLFREQIDFETSAYETLKELSKQNIVYIEAFFSPWDYASTLKMGIKSSAFIVSIIAVAVTIWKLI